MSSNPCASCRQPKAALACGACHSPLCKRCAQTLEANRFSFLASVPEELTHRIYCGPCFNEKVAPAEDAYAITMERAKGVFVFVKSKGEETRLYKRNAKPLRVVDCVDREETILRLAFFAAEAGYNALIDVDVHANKVRNAGYQTSRWQGVAIPTHVDGVKLDHETAQRLGTASPFSLPGNAHAKLR